MATYQGHLTVNGETIDVADWVGSQNHNWGSKHTDRYAWGQVAGFDAHPEGFFRSGYRLPETRSALDAAQRDRIVSRRLTAQSF
jgi:hypothetical protein